MKRVVVTGMGLVTPLGCCVEKVWKRLIAGESGITSITAFDTSDLPSKIAGQVLDTSPGGDFCPLEWITERDLKKMDRFITLGVTAACKALQDSGWAPQSDDEKERTGVLIGAGIGGLPEIARTAVSLHESGARRGVSPFFVPSSLINLTSGHVSILCDLRGPNLAVVTACSSGSNAIEDAYRLIQCGDADVMVAGGSESAVCRIGVSGFSALRALSTHFNEEPERASRPWDRDRDGFVIGEGAGIVILEELEHARKRGARIYGEIVGYGLSSDAYHMTLPLEDGAGAFRCMKNALKKAGIHAEDIGYINAHGTSTPAGDRAELAAVERLFGQKEWAGVMSSTKSAVGHLLGAAGSVEAIFTLLALHHGQIPPTLNLENPEITDIDLAPLKAQTRAIEYAMSNSFGFGGTNVSLVFKRYRDA